MNKKLLNKLDHYTFSAQAELIKRLKLYNFTSTAIKYFCKYQRNQVESYDFSEFKNKFRLISFKKDKEIKSIKSKEIIEVGNSFIGNELADSIFVLNMSTFEHWLLSILRIRFLDTPSELFEDSKKDISIKIIQQVNDLDELWEKIIDDYLHDMPYDGVKKMLERFLKKFKIDKSKITHYIIDKIYENSLCRNLIVHNQKKVSSLYIDACGKFAKFKEGEMVAISEDILFSQGDNLLRFMQDFRKNINV